MKKFVETALLRLTYPLLSFELYTQKMVQNNGIYHG